MTVFSPLFEFVVPHRPDLHLTGLTLVNLVALIGLIWLARRVARWETASTSLP